MSKYYARFDTSASQPLLVAAQILEEQGQRVKASLSNVTGWSDTAGQFGANFNHLATRLRNEAKVFNFGMETYQAVEAGTVNLSNISKPSLQSEAGGLLPVHVPNNVGAITSAKKIVSAKKSDLVATLEKQRLINEKVVAGTMSASQGSVLLKTLSKMFNPVEGVQALMSGGALGIMGGIYGLLGNANKITGVVSDAKGLFQIIGRMNVGATFSQAKSVIKAGAAAKKNTASTFLKGADKVFNKGLPILGAVVGFMKPAESVGHRIGNSVVGAGVSVAAKAASKAATKATAKAAGKIGLKLGAKIGTAIPIPLLGTLVGAVVGLGIGVAAGAFLNSAAGQ